jgi:hypothetical protein
MRQVDRWKACTMSPPYRGYNEMTHIIRPHVRTSRLKIVLSVLLATTIITASLHQCREYFLAASPRVITRSLPEERDSTGYSAAERLMLEGVLSGACDGWEPPSGNTSRTGCWKDNWYTQLTDVLDNWEEYSDLSYVPLASP